MYRCPHCSERKISALSQLSPPFDGVTICPACKTEVKVKRKVTNFLVVAYFLFAIALSAVVGLKGFSTSFEGLVILIALAVTQIRFTEYEIAGTKN